LIFSCFCDTLPSTLGKYSFLNHCCASLRYKIFLSTLALIVDHTLQLPNYIDAIDSGNFLVTKRHGIPKDEAVWVHDQFHEIHFYDSKKDSVDIIHNIDVGYPKRIKSYNGTKNFGNVLMQSCSYDGNAKGYSNHKDEAVWLHDRFYEINRHDGQRDNVSFMHIVGHCNFDGTATCWSSKQTSQVS
jgi:hypothetical protein